MISSRQTLFAVLSPEEKRAQLNDMKPEHSLSSL